MLNNISKVMIGSAGVLAVTAVAAPGLMSTKEAKAETTTFEVNVAESLSVSVTTPSTWASGSVDSFLRNGINVSVTSNNANGFKASMQSSGSTDLTNTTNNTITIPTLTASTTKSSFPANYWGYSLDDTSSGSDSSTYLAMSTSPITLLNESNASSGSKDVYFGAKANMSQAAGTYTGTVVVNVVTGTVNENSGNTDYNPTTPTNPATPNPTNNTPTYNSAVGGSDNTPSGVGISTTTGASPSSGGTRYRGTTTYTTRSSNIQDDTTTTTTEVSGGDTRNSYTSPQGKVISTEANVADGSSTLTTALATTATVAAASGIFFFIVAKRREDDDEEEQQ